MTRNIFVPCWNCSQFFKLKWKVQLTWLVTRDRRSANHSWQPIIQLLATTDHPITRNKHSSNHSLQPITRNSWSANHSCKPISQSFVAAVQPISGDIRSANRASRSAIHSCLPFSQSLVPVHAKKTITRDRLSTNQWWHPISQSLVTAD